MAIEKKYYENEEKEDIKFPELLNYENLVYSPEQLKDINYTEGKKLNDAINDEGQVITDLINSKLNTQTKQILDGFTFGTSGAIKMIRDADNGLWLSPNGILGKKEGAITFSITTLGDATFAGLLMAASGTLGTITSANITAGTFQTATSGRRIVISNSDNSIKIYDENGTLQGTIYGASGYGIYIDGDLELVGNLDAGSGNITGYRFYINADSGVGIEPTWNNSITCGSSSYRWSNIYSVDGNFSGNVTVGGNVYGSFYTDKGCASGHHQPYYDNYYDLGNTNYMWRNLFLRGYIWISGYIMGSLRPFSNNVYDLGDSTHKWYSVYRTYEYSCDLPTHNSAIDVFKKIKNSVMQKGDYGERKYFKTEDFPDEMKNKNDKGEMDIELTQTMGVTVQAVRELVNKVELLEQKVYATK